jgi:hypothetical protein
MLTTRPSILAGFPVNGCFAGPEAGPIPGAFGPFEEKRAPPPPFAGRGACQALRFAEPTDSANAQSRVILFIYLKPLPVLKTKISPAGY